MIYIYITISFISSTWPSQARLWQMCSLGCGLFPLNFSRISCLCHKALQRHGQKNRVLYQNGSEWHSTKQRDISPDKKNVRMPCLFHLLKIPKSPFQCAFKTQSWRSVCDIKIAKAQPCRHVAMSLCPSFLWRQ